MIPEPSASVHLVKDDTYLPEVWIWFAAGIIVIALRWFVRTRTVGFAGLKLDDYLTIVFMAFWTINAVIVQITYYTGGNVDVMPDQALTLSDHDTWVLVYGSKWEFASWYTYSATIWTLKFQVLCFYNRLNLDLITSRSVQIIFIVTGLAYAALALTISLSCRPYHYNWQIKPLPSADCTFRPQNFWTLVVLNVLTDVAIMSIPTPLLFRLRISWPRKLGVSALLLSGLFMIATAIVRAVQTLTGAPSVININRWGFRETGVGMIAVNAATLLPLFKGPFWVRGGHRAQRHHHHHHHHRHQHQHHQQHARAAVAGSPGQEERNRRPSGVLVMKWDAVLLWTRSVVSSSQGGSGGGSGGGVSSGGEGVGGGAGSTISRGGLRSGIEPTVDTTGTRDLEHGVAIVETVDQYELREREQGREREQEKEDPLDKLNGTTVELREIATASTEMMMQNERDGAGPSEQGGDLSPARSPGSSASM